MNSFQMFPDAITKGLPELVETMKEFTKSSNELQKKLVLWTKVMAIALIIQIIVLIITLIS